MPREVEKGVRQIEIQESRIGVRSQIHGLKERERNGSIQITKLEKRESQTCFG